MRAICRIVGVLFLASCSGSTLPNTFTGTASGGGALGCVTDRLDDLGYHTVSGSAGPGSSFVRLERENDEPFWLNIIGIADSFDVLDATMQGSTLRVNAFSQILRGGERQSAAPSDDARSEARDVLDACT